MKKDLVDDMITFASDELPITQWESLFKRQLSNWGFNKIAQDSLFRWGECGYNWKRLHLSEEEQRCTKEQWLDIFYCEVFYCSDRMSLDRLFRCHWLYSNLLHELRSHLES